ncbi:hypothetical protein AK830_g28 [Neonectria ditissima]|uniref:Heterokaryon incompatibility domain-containing protein n=1 Tax=Neonectria ditissima TaxID=78410 RepID=A0A0P7BYM3_9HYPO|nr:hypothetical protein AK830_g28 [Neonectria ditissima]
MFRSNCKSQPAFAYLYREFMEHEDYGKILWRVVSEMTEAPYWHRVWISQEIALSSSVVFWSGDFYLTTKELFIIRWVFLSNPDRHNSILGQYANQEQIIKATTHLGRVMIVLASLRDSHSAEYQQSRRYLQATIDKGRESYSTDLRDKVYGLLALLPQQIALQIKPSYEETWTWQDTWTDFSRICIEYEQRLDIIGACTNPQGGASNLPSWAFDLTPPRPRIEGTEHSTEASGNSLEGLVSFSPARSRRIESFADQGLEAPFHFSDNGRILRCVGILIDTVGILATESDRAMPIFEQQTDTSSPVCFETTKLSLARVMMGNSKYQFSDGPSILDVPYLDRNQIQLQVIHDEFERMKWDPELILRTKDFHVFMSKWVERTISEAGGKRVPWKACFLSTGFFNSWHEEIVPFQGFMIGGRPLRDYFDSQDEFCQDWRQFQFSMLGFGGAMRGRRLFTTEKGRLGSITKRAICGDRVAVLSGCNVPVVLRPKGDGYELVGSCFVDGLMNGESQGILERNQAVLEDIAIY